MPKSYQTSLIACLSFLYFTSSLVASFGSFGDHSETKKENLLFFSYDITRKSGLNADDASLASDFTSDTSPADNLHVEKKLNKRYLKAAEIVDDKTSNPADQSFQEDEYGNSKTEDTLDILDTLAHGPNYKNVNPYPRKFWPDVNPTAAIYIAMVSTVWLTVLSLYLYIRFSGRSYDALFNEEDSDSHNNLENKKLYTAENSRNDKRVVKQVSIVGQIEEEDES